MEQAQAEPWLPSLLDGDGACGSRGDGRPHAFAYLGHQRHWVPGTVGAVGVACPALASLCLVALIPGAAVSILCPPCHQSGAVPPSSQRRQAGEAGEPSLLMLSHAEQQAERSVRQCGGPERKGQGPVPSGCPSVKSAKALLLPAYVRRCENTQSWVGFDFESELLIVRLN